MRIPLVPFVLAASLLALLAAPACGASGKAAWMDDLGPALVRAQTEGKDVLVDFTGSDWCGWCIRLHDEVFSKDEFLEYASEHFVLVALDFPKQGGAAWKRMSDGLRLRNAREQQAFGIRGYPTVLLMTADGTAYARTGYQQGGAANYVRHLEGFRTGRERKAIVDLRASLRDGEGKARLAAAYALHADTWSGGRKALVDVARELDPKDSKGLLLGRLRELVDAGVADEDRTDWKAVVEEGRAFGEAAPVLRDKSLYHALLGMAAVRARDGELARGCLARLDELGGVQPQWLEDFRVEVAALGEG